jgi:hypothetical protein
MPLESGDLPRAVVENQLNNYYRAGIVNGQSRTALYNATKSTDLGIRKTDSLAISRNAEAQANVILGLRELPLSQPIQPSNMLEMNNSADKSFQYVVSVSMLDESGAPIDQPYLRVNSDAIMSKQDIMSQAEDLAKEYYGEDIDVTTNEVTEAWINTA